MGSFDHDSMPADVEVRTAARVILLDAQDRVLLLAARDPADGRVVWFVPGGGLEGSESAEQAARRELAEEVPAAADVALAGPVWTRHHDFSWNGHHVCQAESFFVGRLSRPLAAEDVQMTGAEQRYFEGARWATLADLRDWAADELMAPHRLANLLEPILRGEYPDEPIDAGV